MSRDHEPRNTLALPHAPATEASVLASCLMDHRYWPLAESLDGEVESLFYEPDHRAVASAMHRLHQAGRMVNEDAVVDSLRAAGESLDGGSREFLTEMGLRAYARSQTEFKDQVIALGQQRSLRRIHTQSLQLAEEARVGELSPTELAEKAVRIAENGRSTSEPLKRFGDYLDGMWDNSHRHRIPTNLQGLNDVIGGWEAGRIYALAARPKVGKTTLALNSVVTALANDAAVLVFSLEMGRRELAGRLIACTAFVPQNEVVQWLDNEKSLDDFPQEQRESLEQAREDLGNAPLWVVEAGEVRSGIQDVLAAVVEAKSHYPADKPFVVFVDYVQLLVQDATNSVAEITNITRELKLLASREDIPVVLLSQINRGGAENEGGMPSPHQMRGSGSIEQDADVTILLNRKSLQDENHPVNDMDIWVALSRYSKTGWVHGYYSPAEQVITDPEGGSAVRSGARDDEDDVRTSSRPGSASAAGARDAQDSPFRDGGVDDNSDGVDFEEYAEAFGLG